MVTGLVIAYLVANLVILLKYPPSTNCEPGDDAFETVITLLFGLPVWIILSLGDVMRNARKSRG